MSKIILSLLTIGTLGCASVGVGKPEQQAASSEAVEIRFKGQVGSVFTTKYFSTSRILTYSDRQLIRDRTESVDFTVKNEIKAVDNNDQTISFSVSTIQKDGVVPLHDLAFPELGEVIDYVIKNTGEVLQAGAFPRQSIFYVPSMPIPKNRVEVGDTWTMEYVWASRRDGFPLSLQIVAILKDVVTCRSKQKCADVEISGHVGLVVSPDVKEAKFDSRIWGRLLFDLERGDVIWSQTRSHEDMRTKAERVSVASCMVSEAQYGGKYSTKLECEPGEQAVDKVPKL